MNTLAYTLKFPKILNKIVLNKVKVCLMISRVKNCNKITTKMLRANRLYSEFDQLFHSFRMIGIYFDRTCETTANCMVSGSYSLVAQTRSGNKTTISVGFSTW